VLIPFLEDCYYDHVTVESSPLERYVAETLEGAVFLFLFWRERREIRRVTATMTL